MLTLPDGRVIENGLSADKIIDQILNDSQVQTDVSRFLSYQDLPSTATGMLVVIQGEKAMVPRNQMAFVGSTDATTCCIVGLVSSQKAWIAHFDEGTAVHDLQALDDAMDDMTSDLISLFLMGSFADLKGISTKTVKSLLRHLHGHKAKLSIQLACILNLNTSAIATSEGTEPAPIAQSLAIDLCTSSPSSADLSDRRGPELPRRFSYSHCSPSSGGLVSIFDPLQGVMVLPQFTVYLSPSHLQYLIKVLAIDDDKEFLHMTSTSPKVEGKDFVSDIRAAYRWIVLHQGQSLPSRDFKLAMDCGWTEVAK